MSFAGRAVARSSRCGTRPGGYGGWDFWMTRRASRSAPWEPAVNLGPIVNGPTRRCTPCFAPDGSALYFWLRRRHRRRYWKAPILPIVDFNGDGKVDAEGHGSPGGQLGQEQLALCDIGPFAWGDGVVDEKDLRVLMESLVTPGPQATDVPCDVVLSWTSPSFAEAYDVYFGTSCEAVNNASRADPHGVLVSQGQTETTYDPAGLLEFSRTYYWRVDFVIPGPTPTIYKGPVLTFTTESFAHPIKNIIATASSAQPGMGPEKTVDGSGLDKNDGHSTDANGHVAQHGDAAALDSVRVRPRSTLCTSCGCGTRTSRSSPILGFGAKTVKIEYSTDGTTWTPLEGVPEFARAPGQAGYVHNTMVSFGGVSAKYVKLTIEKNWGGTPADRPERGAVLLLSRTGRQPSREHRGAKIGRAGGPAPTRLRAGG